MTQRSPERERLDEAGELLGSLPALTVLPYIAAYVVAALATTGFASAELTNGVFIVVLAALFVGTSSGTWRNATLSRPTRVLVIGGAVILGVVVGSLVVEAGLG